MITHRRPSVARQNITHKCVFPCFSPTPAKVEEGQTVLVMNEPDLSEDMDGWSEWYKNITEAVERLKLELDERF